MKCTWDEVLCKLQLTADVEDVLCKLQLTADVEDVLCKLQLIADVEDVQNQANLYISLCNNKFFKSQLAMRWLRLVGSLKLWVSFAEYRLFYRALLWKRPIILRSLLIVATAYQVCDTQ